MALVLKRDEETKQPIITEDQKIIYYDDQDPEKKDLPLDPAAMYDKIGDLGKQNKKDRDLYRGLRDQMKPFEGIENLEEWKKEADNAIETVGNFNDKDWMKAEKVEKLKSDMRDSYEAKLAGKDEKILAVEKDAAEKLSGKDTQIRALMVSTKFAQSKQFVGENKKTILPPDIGEAYFGSHFKVEQPEGGEGKPVLRAYRANGDLITSKINPGDPAEFEEAIAIIIDEYPNRDSILAAPGSGSGGKGGEGNQGESDDLASLKKQHQEALSNGNSQLAISLKNKIFALEHK